MKRCIPQRILSAFLAFVLLISSSPVVYAAEMESVAEPTEAVLETVAAETEAEEILPETEAPEETEAAEEPESTGETEAPEVTEPAETIPAETVPAETVPEETAPAETVSEETVPEETEEETVPEETVEETVPEETEPVELPYGLAGLPEGYVLSEGHAAAKQALIDNDTVATLANLIPGEDYVADYVIVAAESEEEAAVMAAAISGELIGWVHGMAKVKPLTATVAEVVEASANPAYNLPGVSVSFITRVQPMDTPAQASVYKDLPTLQTWETWVRENMTNPDPALLDPNGSNYQWMHDAVDTYAAWGVSTGDRWVKVAVIDTGVNTSHVDLKGHVSTINIGCGVADEANHGTHVAGIIAGTMNNGSGGAGIAPGVSIISIRASDKYGSFSYYDMAYAIYEAVDAGAHIINMSIQGAYPDYYLNNAIQYAAACGVTVVAAMGNVGSNTISYPAAYDNVIGVAATDSAGNRAHFSNYGAWADIAAPGEDIYSSVNSGGYARYNGTSMACPVVAGAAALYMSALGTYVSPAEMEKALESSATKTKESGIGAGIVNIANMLDGIPAAPYYLIYDGERYYTTKDVIPCDARVYFFESEATAFNGTTGDVTGALLLTLDGSTPSIKNGEIINGICLEEDISMSLESFKDSTVTIKAARVSGMGIMGKVLTLKLKVGGSDYVEGITIHGAEYMMMGKSSTYTAVVEPADTADQSVYWDIVGWSAGMSGAKIDKNGKLTVPKGRAGIVRIRATSLADPYVYTTFDVNVADMPQVSKIYLNFTNAYLYIGQGGTMKVTKMTEANGLSLNLDYYKVAWSSSNPKIASIDEYGYVTGHAKGNVTITCKALDGSNKTATCKLEVRQMVDYIELTGQSSIAPGTSATYKATVYPKDATYNKVNWYLENAPYGVTIDQKTGKVTVASFVRQDTTFQVVAVAQDEYEAYTYMDVTVRAKCTGIYIGSDGYDGLASGIQYSGRWVKTATIFSLDLDDSYGTDNQIDLDCWYSGPGNGLAHSWSSSAPEIASVDANGIVTAHKAGTAKITLTALDGSNKKATCSIVVTNPASSISISSSAPRMSSSLHYLAFGKSAKNTAVFADTYGKPTNQKVSWSLEVLQIDHNGDVVADWTNDFIRNKLVSINSSGNLSVSKSAEYYWHNDLFNETLDEYDEFVVYVYAEAQDGTGVWGATEYVLIAPTTVVKTEYKNYTAYAGSGGTITFYSDQWYGFDASFSVTSSNPKIVSLGFTENGYKVEYVGYNSYYRMNEYRIQLELPGTRGSATITIKALDGSNKSASCKITAY